MSEYVPNRAPERLVDRVLMVMAPAERHPTMDPQRAQAARRAQARVIADQIWTEAHFAGQVFNQSLKPARIYLCHDCPKTTGILQMLPNATPAAS